jgi:hypothetical protein
VTLLNIFGFAMSIVYIGIGLYILIWNNIFNFSNLQQIGFGSIIIVYGLFRFYITLKKKREEELDDDD